MKIAWLWKKNILGLLIFLPAFTFSFVRAEEGHDHEDEEVSSSVGPGKAIVAATKKDGFQLSEKAVAILGLTYTPVTTTGSHSVSRSCVVFFQDEAGVYRLRDGKIKLVEIEITSRNSAEIVFKSQELIPGDQVVKSGVPLLRAAELEASGGSGEGHGH